MSLSKIQIAFLSCLWVALDFFTKNVLEKKSFFINQFLQFRLVKEFPKFDLMPQFNQYALQIAIVGSILSLIILIYFFTQYYSRIILISIGMIMAGVIGNLIDKLYFGWSRVFVDFHHPKLLMFFDTPHFPLFNLADALIVWGAFIFIFNKKW